MGRTIMRYLTGTFVIALVILGGVSLRVMQFADDVAADGADAIVVMGAAQYNGRPSAVFAARLDHAAALYRAGDAGHVITVGGRQATDAYTEATAGRDYLADAGLPREALTAVQSGWDTVTSLRAAARLMDTRGWDSVIIVTDPWHSARCRAVARDLGLDVQLSPVTSGPATDRSVRLRYILRETLGLTFYRLTGGSSGLGHAVI